MKSKQPNLIDGPLPIQREPLEEDVTTNSLRWAREKGAYCRKFRSPANRSVPDYIVLYRGLTVYVEFKRDEKKVPTDLQLEQHDLIRAAGGIVWVVGSVGQFKRFWEQTWG